MPPDEEQDDTPAYRGSFVVLRASGLDYRVTVEPPLPGAGGPLTFSSKNQAWAEAQVLWTRLRLPFQDETEGHFGRRNALKYSDE